MYVQEIMSASPIVLPAEESLAKAAAIMERRHLRHLPVVDHGRVIGMLCERDLLEATARAGEHWLDAESGRPAGARDHMRVPVESVARDEELESVCRRLLERKVGCLPVLDGEELVGVLTVSDVLAAYVESRRGRSTTEDGDPPVEQLMATEPVTVDGAATVAQALELTRLHDLRHLPVMVDGWLAGVVSDRDLRAALGRGEPSARIQSIMTTHFVGVPPGARLSEASRAMLEHGLGAVLVTESGRLHGVLSASDVLRHCARVPVDAGA